MSANRVRFTITGVQWKYLAFSHLHMITIDQILTVLLKSILRHFHPHYISWPNAVQTISDSISSFLYFKWGGSYVDWLDCTPQSLFGSFLNRVLPTQDSTCGQGGDRQVAGLQAQGEEQSDQDPGVVCPAPPAPWSPLGFLSPSPLCWCTEPKTLLPVRY